MSTTGNFARGTGCCGTTSVERGLYSRMLGGGNSGSRPSAGRGRICPGGCCAPADGQPANGARLPQQRRSLERISTTSRSREKSQRAVSRILFPASASAPCGAGDGSGDDHSSSPPSLAGSSDRPGGSGRAVRFRPKGTPPYLVLLRAGFCLPPVLPRARCALTAPFHPYPPPPFAARGHPVEACRAASRAREGRYVFCATFLRVTLTGRYPAHCPAEFGLSSRLRRERSSGSLRQLECTARRSAAPRPAEPRPSSRGAGSVSGAAGAGGLGASADKSASCRSRPTRPSPARSGTARASCRDCCGACRSLRRSSRCSSRSRAAWRPDRRARTMSLNSRSVPAFAASASASGFGAASPPPAGSRADGRRRVRIAPGRSGDVDRVAAGHDDQPLHRVPQLADVALPAVALQRLERGRA